jgi:hypothetical protein
LYSVADHLLHMKKHLETALASLPEGEGTAIALDNLRQAAAFGVRCIEIHGAPQRGGGGLSAATRLSASLKRAEMERRVPIRGRDMTLEQLRGAPRRRIVQTLKIILSMLDNQYRNGDGASVTVPQEAVDALDLTEVLPGRGIGACGGVVSTMLDMADLLYKAETGGFTAPVEQPREQPQTEEPEPGEQMQRRITQIRRMSAAIAASNPGEASLVGDIADVLEELSTGQSALIKIFKYLVEEAGAAVMQQPEMTRPWAFNSSVPAEEWMRMAEQEMEPGVRVLLAALERRLTRRAGQAPVQPQTARRVPVRSGADLEQVEAGA